MDASAHERDPAAALSDELAGLWSGLTGADAPMTPAAVVAMAGQALPNSASICLVLRRHDQSAEVLASSDGIAAEVAQIQDELGEGPCLDAAVGSTVVQVYDLRTDGRWPTFASACVARTGVRSALCFRMPIGRQDEAALCFHSTEPAAFSDEDALAGSVVAPLTAMAVKGHLRQGEINHLKSARGSARSLGSAVASLMAERGIDRREAFDVVRRAGQDARVGLQTAADDVIRGADTRERT